MLRRVAFSLLFLVVLGIAGILAAGHLGIQLPWSIAARDDEPSSKDREHAAPAPADTAKTVEKSIEETTAALGAAPQALENPGDIAIDISRISPNGISVFAGRAAPDTYVTVMEDGKPAGTVKVGSNGDWSLATEHKFASADPKLTYEVSRTPPPAPEPPNKQVAKAEPASPTAVAGEVMRKFENLVEEARQEANKEATTKDTAPSPSVADAAQPPETATPVSPPAAQTETPPTVTVEKPSHVPAASAGVKTDVIPVPLMFVYNEATLTPEGARAAALLLEYLTLKHLSQIELTGHADERGTDDYNYDLSRERLDTVFRLLKDGGYAGELKLTPKGKTEPYTGVDRAAYKGEALYQLDRRVELRVTR